MLKRIPYKQPRNPLPVMPKGGLGRSRKEAAEPELLTGLVKGWKASKGEERAAIAISRNTHIAEYVFRMTIGAERNMPGFKELDFLITTTYGMYYAVEVDSAFTHREKGTSDILHDAIILQNLKHLNIYPQVIHWDIDRDLPDIPTAEKTVRNLVG
jgi:hypothetical protein